MEIGFFGEILQSNGGDRCDQTDKNVDTRNQNETGRWRFEEIIDRIHQRNDGETVEEEDQDQTQKVHSGNVRFNAKAEKNENAKSDRHAVIG